MTQKIKELRKSGIVIYAIEGNRIYTSIGVIVVDVDALND
jgi:hypothetical protein